MSYSIKNVSDMFGISSYTIRFYDKEGLFPYITRNKSGNREFSDDDLEWIKIICCLKNTGMKIKEIKQYIDWYMLGEETKMQRKKLLIDHRSEVLNQIDELKKNLEIINHKISLYDVPVEELDQPNCVTPSFVHQNSLIKDA